MVPSGRAQPAMRGIQARLCWRGSRKLVDSATWGPDHSQIEIYHESKHGVLYNAQKSEMNLKASPKALTTARYACADVCDVPFERLRWLECDARYNRTPLVLAICCGL